MRMVIFEFRKLIFVSITNMFRLPYDQINSFGHR